MSGEIITTEAGKPARTLAQVTEEIRYLDTQAKRLVLGHAIEIGRRLKEAKELVPYGEWGDYIEKELSYSQSTAQNFMRIFDEYGAAQQSLFGPVAESQALGNLSYTKALKLLAVPREEREEFAEAVDAEHISTRELETAIRERDEARKAQSAAEAREKEAREELSETAEMLDKTMEEANARGVIIREREESLEALEKELAELKSRPVEVAVQEPDPEAVEKLAEKRAAELAAGAQKAQAEAEQAAAAAKAEAEQKIKKAKEQAKVEREKLEAKLKEAEAKISAAGEADRAETEKLRGEADALRKQLAMSSQEIVIFRLRFMAWQEAHKLMSEAFDALGDEETKEKMRAAIRAQVKAWGWTE